MACNRPSGTFSCISAGQQVLLVLHQPYKPWLRPYSSSQQQQWVGVRSLCKITHCQNAFNLATPAGDAAKAAACGVAATVVKAPAVALDVEYAHYTTAEGKQVSFPAWVALVDQDCAVLVKTYIQHKVTNGWRWIGGVSPSASAGAPSLPDVVGQLHGYLADTLLLGHGLSKDLAALGLQHPPELRFDTMTHPGFCNKAGNAYNLKQLAKQFLSQDIQQQQPHVRQRASRRGKKQRQTAVQQQQQPGADPLGNAQAPAGYVQSPGTQEQHLQHDLQGGCGQQQHRPPQQPQSRQHYENEHQPLPQGQQRQEQQQRQTWPGGGNGHDPQEDAVAVMQLYQQVVFPTTYEGQVAAATAKLLAAMQESQHNHDDHEGGAWC